MRNDVRRFNCDREFTTDEFELSNRKFVYADVCYSVSGYMIPATYTSPAEGECEIHSLSVCNVYAELDEVEGFTKYVPTEDELKEISSVAMELAEQRGY